jgi:hypothetical protein
LICKQIDNTNTYLIPNHLEPIGINPFIQVLGQDCCYYPRKDAKA